MVFGVSRGLVKIMLERRRLRVKITRENILREIYEYLEISGVGKSASEALPTPASEPISFSRLLKLRSWSAGHLTRGLKRLCSDGLVSAKGGATYQLTAEGLDAAAQVTRKHRLWEVYLIAHADIATGQVDWGADEIEHILDDDMIAKLEKMLPAQQPLPMPASPHSLKPVKETV